jgi:hypothetical protein
MLDPMTLKVPETLGATDPWGPKREAWLRLLYTQPPAIVGDILAVTGHAPHLYGPCECSLPPAGSLPTTLKEAWSRAEAARMERQ